MNTQISLGISGSILLVFGVFLPMVQNQVFGELNLMSISSFYSFVLIALAFFGIFASVSRKFPALVIPAIASSAVIIVSYIDINNKATEAMVNASKSLAGNPYSSLGKSLVVVNFGWAWAALIAGVLLLLAASFFSEPQKCDEK